MDAGRLNIVTVEDPVEFDLPGVGQIHVNSKIDLSLPRPCAQSCARTRT